jgi:hypothetical protein
LIRSAGAASEPAMAMKVIMRLENETIFDYVYRCLRYFSVVD